MPAQSRITHRSKGRRSSLVDVRTKPLRAVPISHRLVPHSRRPEAMRSPRPAAASTTMQRRSPPWTGATPASRWAGYGPASSRSEVGPASPCMESSPTTASTASPLLQSKRLFLAAVTRDATLSEGGGNLHPTDGGPTCGQGARNAAVPSQRPAHSAPLRSPWLRRGSVTVNVEPSPGPGEDAMTSPPCRRAMLRAMVSPIPVPPGAARSAR